MTVNDLFSYADRVTSFILILAFIYGHYKGWIVWGKDCNDTKKERDTLRSAMDLVNKGNAEKLSRLEEIIERGQLRDRERT
jgi:hypothetical protein